MKTLKSVLFLAYAAFIGYTLVLFLSGEAGMSVLGERESYRNELINNIDELQGIHTELNSELSLMRSSGEKNRILARALGYFEKNEFPVHSEVFVRSAESLQIGRILNKKKSEVILSNARIALSIGLCFIIASLIVAFMQKRNT